MFHLRGIPYSLDLNQRMCFLGGKMYSSKQECEILVFEFLGLHNYNDDAIPSRNVNIAKYFSLSLCSFMSFILLILKFILLCIYFYHLYNHLKLL